MSKYSIARAVIANGTKQAEEENVDTDEMLLALLVCAVEAYRDGAGKDAARAALIYELDELGGTVDTVFLRAR